MALASSVTKGNKMPFWKCFYHGIWSTHRRVPVITNAMEKVIFEAIESKTRAMDGMIFAINGVEDHIHVAVTFPPHVAAAEWVRIVKGLSAHNVNDSFPNLETRFQWQKGYGLLTFGANTLPDVVRYVEQQKSHHANKTINAYLEQSDD
jgi:putative transposase